MTNEEAIDFINNKIQIDVRFCSDDNINETKTALTLAIEALEKQTPKRVKSYKTFGGCPVCGYVLNFELVNKYGIKHCPECGQALDFSERSNTDEN